LALEFNFFLFTDEAANCRSGGATCKSADKPTPRAARCRTSRRSCDGTPEGVGLESSFAALNAKVAPLVSLFGVIAVSSPALSD
jgi:hypothetical protein